MKRYQRGVSLAGFYVTPEVLFFSSLTAVLIAGAVLNTGVNKTPTPILYPSI